ncbi:Protein LATERAL ORGAN BOUNDARIES [Heracleum sosnowskyi]|uniref:Protein LATERAL ORGAN BOUNDARIES n=1 Tax=Heracleum sosnowskyi TaxID=360622 RepID=A0AAD8MHM3_9APIA|nr:Protein LATERAL ORGAN BOUNDARIES [Heracleum sosnowskyi]
MASSNSYNSPCAACKFLRRKCMPGCIFAPYFPPEEPQKFANVHKIFGASNVTKLLNELLPQQREDAVNSLAYEAEARVRDPVYGCVGAISFLQRQVERLQKELDAANADLIRFACSDTLPPLPQRPVDLIVSTDNIGNINELIGISSGDTASTCYQTPCTSFSFPSATAYPIPWNSNSFDNNTSTGDVNQGGGEAEKGL